MTRVLIVCWSAMQAVLYAAEPPVIQTGPTEFSVQFADGVKIELEGVNSPDTSLPIIWQPNGEIKVRPDDWPALFAFKEQNPTHGFVFRLSGLQPGQQAVWRLPGQWATPAWPDAGLERPAISTRIPLIPGEPEPNPFDIQVGITTADWGPTYILSAEGVLQPLEKPIPSEFQAAFDRVQVKVLDRGNQVGLEFQGVQGVDNYVQHRAVIQRVEGTFFTPWATTASVEGHRVDLFKVEKNNVDAIAYRLRPFVHWVTFQNVSLHPGSLTECRIQVRESSPPQP